MSRSESNWQLFDYATTHRSLFVLGAGASMPTISNDLRARLKREIRDLGAWSGVSHAPTPLTKRLLPRDDWADILADYYGTVSQNDLNAHTPPAVIETLVMRLITASESTIVPQYQVFNRFFPSIVFNFNNDNLADVIDGRRHLHLRPHGFIHAAVVHSPGVTDALRSLAISDDFVGLFDYHRPMPEPSRMTTLLPYQTLMRTFASAHVIVIAGYSFGDQLTTWSSIDDLESFELLTDLLRWRPRPVLVVGPDPERMVYRIESAVRRRLGSILQCRWNVLAEFVLSRRHDAARRLLGGGGRRVMDSEYWRFEEEVEIREARRLPR
jgi:hypothetical protein